MFTRYTGINIPSNYNGNRFSKSTEKMDTKIHSNQTQNTVKSSISPSFEKALTSSAFDEYIEPDVTKTEETNIIEEQNVNTIDSNTTPLEDLNKDAKSMQNNTKNISMQIKNSPIGEFFKYVKGDDLLLITLIIMLASENSLNNYDTIILLALLLAYHA